MRPIDELDDVAAFYTDFAEHEAKGESVTFAQWAAGVARDPEVLELLGELPPAKRQPNLVFAAARWHGALTPSRYDDDEGLRTTLLSRWPRVRETILTRATQTNEVGRSASLLPLLAGLQGPLDERIEPASNRAAESTLALEKLDEFQDEYDVGTTIVYHRESGLRPADLAAIEEHGAEIARIDPAGGPSPVVLDCTVTGPVPVPPSPPVVVHRGGVDLNPLDLSTDGNAAWLETLVWPEHEDRRQRLAAACEHVADVAVDIIPGDLLTCLDEAVERARTAAPGATVVVFHTAVIAYLDEGGRRAWPHVVTETLEPA